MISLPGISLSVIMHPRLSKIVFLLFSPQNNYNNLDVTIFDDDFRWVNDQLSGTASSS